MDWDKVSAQLSRKLDPANVRPAKAYGPKGDYIEGWHAIAEANRIFGFNGWSHEVTECKCVSERPREVGREKKPGFGVTYTAKVRVSVDCVVREDFGAGHGYDIDCGLAHESAIKEAVTDALKRALRYFGSPFGLALYDKSRENVGSDEPAFDHAAAAARIRGRFAKASSAADLQDTYHDEKETIARIGLLAPALVDEIRGAFAARLAAVKAPVPAAPDALEDDAIPY
jgi:DNA repair and recombination protein RAD52